MRDGDAPLAFPARPDAAELRLDAQLTAVPRFAPQIEKKYVECLTKARLHRGAAALSRGRHEFRTGAERRADEVAEI
jgi:hypothetical protein